MERCFVLEALIAAETLVFVGFSLADFDKMARIQLLSCLGERSRRGLSRQRIVLIDPNVEVRRRFNDMFGRIEARLTKHEDFDWQLLA